MSDWQRQIESELELANTSREMGNEGKARVCARRAAGIAIREYFNRRGVPVSGASAYDLINKLAEMPDASTEVKELCSHLSTRVTEDFELPTEIDLLKDSLQLCHTLLPEWDSSLE